MHVVSHICHIDTDTYVQVATLLVKMESDVKTAWQVRSVQHRHCYSNILKCPLNARVNTVSTACFKSSWNDKAKSLPPCAQFKQCLVVLIIFRKLWNVYKSIFKTPRWVNDRPQAEIVYKSGATKDGGGYTFYYKEWSLEMVYSV